MTVKSRKYLRCDELDMIKASRLEDIYMDLRNNVLFTKEDLEEERKSIRDDIIEEISRTCIRHDALIMPVNMEAVAEILDGYSEDFCLVKWDYINHKWVNLDQFNRLISERKSRRRLENNIKNF